MFRHSKRQTIIPAIGPSTKTPRRRRHRADHQVSAAVCRPVEQLEQRTLMSAQPTLSVIATSPNEIDVTFDTQHARAFQLQEKGPGETEFHALKSSGFLFTAGPHTVAVQNLKPDSHYSFRLVTTQRWTKPNYIVARATTLSNASDTLVQRPPGNAAAPLVVSGTSSSGSGQTVTIFSAGVLSASGVNLSMLPNASINSPIATFTDSDQTADVSQFSANIIWGDNTSSPGTIVSDGNGGFAVDAVKTYSQASATPYTANITINDTDGSQMIVLSTFTVALPAPAYSVPSSNPALPVGFNTFAPPVNSSAPQPGVSAPIITASNLMAQPDQNITLTGSNFTANSGANAYTDTRFLVYGQTTTSNPTLTDSQIQDNTSSGSMVTINSTEPANSMYFLWPENGAGIGTPTVVNKTQAWWLSNAAQASAGQTISLYGENLSNGSASPQSWIYIQPASGPGEWATVNAVNPYKVDFTVPADLANGTYQVWANNGLGGKYGWGAPLSLTINTASSWDPNLVVNVKNYGAVGDGVTDDGPAINRALAALGPGPAGEGSGHTLYFPAGTYLVGNDEHFDIPRDFRMVGQSTASTTILFPYAPVDHGKGTYLISTRDQNGANVEFDSMTIKSTWVPTYFPNNGNPYWQRVGDMVRAVMGSNFTLDNVSLQGNGLTPINLQGSSGVTLKNSTVVGIDIPILSAQDISINNTAFYERYEDNAALVVWNSHNISVTNSTVQNYDDTTTDGTGTGQGRFLEDGLDWNSIYHEYVAGNKTINMGARPNSPINAGEQINIEGSRDVAYGVPSAVSGTSITFAASTFNPVNSASFNSSFSFQTGMDVAITNGTGIGQMRIVTGVTLTGNPQAATSVTLTLDRPWTVNPDGASHLVVTTTAYDSVFYGNTLQTSTGPNGQALGSSTGFEDYSGGNNLVFDGNTTNGVKRAVLVTSAGTSNPALFTEIINNNFNNSQQEAFVMGDGFSSTDPNFIGVTVRNNQVNSAQIAGLDLSWLGYGTETLSIVEDNIVSGTPKGLKVFDDPDVLVYKNTFVSSSINSIAISLENSSATIRLLQNNYQNFASIFGGSLPGNILA
jgi:hypothetical protein